MDPGSLEERVTTLETQVRDLAERVRASEQDAAAARVLAGAADRDISEFRGELRDFRQTTAAGFNALRQDFVDLRDQVDQGFTEIRGTLDATATGQRRLADFIQTLINQQQ